MMKRREKRYIVVFTLVIFEKVFLQKLVKNYTKTEQKKKDLRKQKLKF